MTKSEIKALVAAKIAGQGTQVDVGGALPTILNNTLDLIPEGGGVERFIVNFTFTGSGSSTVVTADKTVAQMKTAYEAGKLMTFRRDGAISSMGVTSAILEYDLMGYLKENAASQIIPDMDYGFLIYSAGEGVFIIASSKDGVENFRYASFG